MNLLQKLKRRLRPEPIIRIAPELGEAAKAVLTPPPPQPKGKVIKGTKRPTFNPVMYGKRGGHVTKAMPRQLQKIKQGQEKLEDETEV